MTARLDNLSYAPRNHWGLPRDWRDEIKVGDVLLEGGNPKKPRVVREVTYRKSGPNAGLLGHVTFAIKRCSWTGRPITVLARTDLKARGFTPARWRVCKMTILDKRLNADIRDPHRRRLSCCDVRGML